MSGWKEKRLSVPEELGTNDMPRIVPSTHSCVPLLEVLQIYIVEVFAFK